MNPEPGTPAPLVSILMPSYNQARFVRAAIESVLGQDYPAIELVVADGGSTDGTLKILREYEGRLSYVSEVDAGQGDALNKALGRSHGVLLGWLNSDDFFLWNGVISAVVAEFERGVDVVYGHSIWVDEWNRVLKTHPRPRYSARRLERFDYISQPATFFRRSAVGAELVDARLQYALDYDLWLRLGRGGRRFARIDDYLAAMRSHPGAKSSRARRDMWAEDVVVRSAARMNRRQLSGSFADLGLMAAMKFRGLWHYRALSLHSTHWCVPLRIPPAPLRPLYQSGLLGGQGGPLLLPRHFIASWRTGPPTGT